NLLCEKGIGNIGVTLQQLQDLAIGIIEFNIFHIGRYQILFGKNNGKRIGFDKWLLFSLTRWFCLT
ncbi:MAG: hypothetical protein MUF28_08145, partial [Ignavibacterium sp.]|nr:hypothetical protein [Ignavibacterium sp.]